MGRSGLRAIAGALEAALVEAGAPVAQLRPPAVEAAGSAGGDAGGALQHWSAVEQVRPEVVVWDRLLQEVCRQVSTNCAPRGALLSRAVARQQQLLSQALCCCDGLWRGTKGWRGEVAAGRAALERAEAERGGLLRLLDDLKVGFSNLCCPNKAHAHEAITNPRQRIHLHMHPRPTTLACAAGCRPRSRTSMPCESACAAAAGIISPRKSRRRAGGWPRAWKLSSSGG